MDKLYRRTQLLELLKAGGAATQSALRKRLASRGIRVTQATISRDVEELGLVKTRQGYRLPLGAAAVPQPGLPVVLKEFLRDVRLASNLVIVKTHPGNAHTVAAAMDTAAWPEIVGTVAGDDTIFIAAPNARQASAIRKKILAAVR